MDTLFNPTLEDDIKKVLAEVPSPIRAFIANGKVQVVARNLMQKNQLHIDQGAIVGREIMLLLLGINTPSEFTQALAEEAKLTKIVIDGIVRDVNDQIFVPLRKEEEKGGAVEPQIQPAAPKAEPVTHFNLQNKIPLPRPAAPAPAPAPVPKKDWSPPVGGLQPAPMKGTLPPKVFLPRSSTLGDVVRSVLAVPKPVDTDKLLEDHEEPHVELNKADVPVNLPGVLPPIAQEVQPSPEILKVEPQIPKPAQVAPIEPKSALAPITSYSSDPYREPIDEPVDEM